MSWTYKIFGVFKKAIEEYEPDCLINTAAYTSVDKAESESELAFAINETAVSFLAKCCKDAKYTTCSFLLRLRFFRK